MLEKALNADPADPNYVVAFNLLLNTPKWLQSINALPMYLGLDLRGGVHFLMQVDMKGVFEQARARFVDGGARPLALSRTFATPASAAPVTILK